jgi:flagellar hook-length control protein FliK
LTGRFSLALKNGAHEVRLQLKPETLGEIKMQIRIEGDVVAARINVESQQVRQIVESNMQSLKDALAEHNLQAGAFDVNVGKGFGDNGHSGAMQADAGNKRASGNGSADSSDESADQAEIAAGDETGRRFGKNTIEYFA